MTHTCPECNGKGIATYICPECQGNGCEFCKPFMSGMEHDAKCRLCDGKGTVDSSECQHFEDGFCEIALCSCESAECQKGRVE